MSKTSDDCLTEQHLMLFGSVIRWFARYELLMLDLTAAVAGSETSAVMVLTRNLGFREKRSVLTDLLRHRSIPMDQFDRINKYLSVANTFLSLRNDIAHSAWICAPSSHLAQPAWIFRRTSGVKPLHVVPDASRANYVEYNEDKLDYSIDDIAEAAKTLAENYESFSAYLQECRLLRTLGESG